MNRQAGRLTIGAFAKMAGVTVETIRFYQRKGLLPEPNKPHGAIRRYGDADVERVRFVKSAQRLGFSLDEVAGLLQLQDGDGLRRSPRACRAPAARRSRQAGNAGSYRNGAARLVDDCSASQGTIVCPLIAALQAPHCIAQSDRP